MAFGIKYFVLNKSSDWKERSVIDNLHFDEDKLISNANTDKGVYISASFDSLQSENIWHRLRLEANRPQNVVIQLKLYASDSLYSMIPGKTEFGDEEVLIDDYLLDDNVGIDDKIKLFDYLGAKEFENPNDLVLFEFRGRYMWICLEITNYNKNIAKISEIKLEFPGFSFVDYLPQIYRGNDKNSFLSRFLFIFQSLYTDLEDEIDKMPNLFDPIHVNEEFLSWITEWFSIKDRYIWGEEKLRLLLCNAIDLYKIKGTKESIKRIVEIYIGETPIIIEQFEVIENEYYKKSKKHIENLFGNNSYTFSVIIKTDKQITSDMYLELLKIINRFKPIDTICNLVVLNNEIYLDYHCYLGLNSYISPNKSIILNDQNEALTKLIIADSDDLK